MVCFVFTAVTVNALLKTELHPTHLWGNWRGTYEEVLPYVRDAFGRVVERVRAAAPPMIAGRIGSLVEQLCDPDPFHRGHLRTLSRPGNPYALERIVTELDLLSRRAEIAVRQAL
jgi:hypothetical protein